MATRRDPKSWMPGEVILHRHGGLATLDGRWQNDAGWYLRDGFGGLNDVAAEADWVLFTPRIGAAVWELLYLGAVS